MARIFSARIDYLLIKQLSANFSAIANSFEQPEGESENFLDTRTGRVIKINYARKWDEEMVATRLLIDSDRGGRYVAIPRPESRVIVRDMADFAKTVQDARVRKALERALIGHRRLHNFIVALGHYTPERMRWHAFKDARMHERVLKWMESVGIALVETE